MQSPSNNNNNASNRNNRSGRGRGGRGRTRGRNSGRGNKHHQSPSNAYNNNNNNTVANKQAEENVLIEFMPYMRQQHPEALSIHETFGGDERAFVEAARVFLQNQKSLSNAKPTTAVSANDSNQSTNLQNKMERLLVKDDEIYSSCNKSSSVVEPLQRSPQKCPLQKILPNLTVTPPVTTNRNNTASSSSIPPKYMTPPPGLSQQGGMNLPHPSTPVSSPARQPVSRLIPRATSTSPLPIHSGSSSGLQQPSALRPAVPGLLAAQQQSKASQQPRHVGNWQAASPGLVTVKSPPEPANSIATKEPAAAKSKPVYQPKRIWTRLDQQPGRIFANDVGPDGGMVYLRPRQELVAKWILPLKYLRQHASEKNKDTSNDELSVKSILDDLTVGLFRRGCTENGTNASIISKQIVAPTDENRNDYPFSVDKRSDLIYGTVPFYAPRTPGHVIFRLYWQGEPLHTLATGPTLFVRVSEEDFESTLRFILSNFKSRKGSATSLSSLNALSTVLEQFTSAPAPPSSRRAAAGLDGAGRAAWGCICESRKVLEVCSTEYEKGKEKIKKLEEEVKELQQEVEQASELEQTDESNEEDSIKSKLKEKTHALMGGRASNDRKWKDSQTAFANILKAVVSNPSASLLFRRELISKIRLEYELWCSLVDAFAASPFNKDLDSLCVQFNDFPQNVTSGHYQQCVESRQKMQLEILGFVPNKSTLQESLVRGGDNQSMDRSAVSTFNSLSAAMGKLYEECYMVSDRILHQREMVRAFIERAVSQCQAFPQGTRVIIFGSSANGFGSPTSDLDMCLQMPKDTKLPGEKEDPTGALAMAELAKMLEGNQMQNVDTARLTARIPIIMFHCPRPMAQEGEEALMECDLSFMNPLAVLNTSLLLTYSRVHPVTRVLAAIIKRWAKARDINNPSKHTLSSYGYILMLLHFLTYHKRIGNGLITSVKTEKISVNAATNVPLLPNLQWMDPNWLYAPPNVLYTELKALPSQILKHPLEDDVVVNPYFYGTIKGQHDLAEIQRRFPSQDLSLAILLASFFRYYAFEFDYKKQVVSLNSTITRGLVEREDKAEVNGWRVYSTGLAIEDPFETSYDVAHVLKGGNFHKLRNELALAYTKIVDAVKVADPTKSGLDLINLICEPVEKAEQSQEEVKSNK